jgi:tRNA pseudouridine38-40 synthase
LILRRIRIDLAYDGGEFAGWQVQPASRTVQGTLEETLTGLDDGRPVRVRASGRTDAGAHARQQVVDCQFSDRLSDSEISNALRRLLPPDVRAQSVRTVPAEFDARRHAIAKTYVYRLDTHRVGDPLARRFSMHLIHALDRNPVDQALNRLRGRHDWSGFTAAKCEVENRVRTMSEARLELHSAVDYRFRFTANGFLTHMVRNLVGTLLEIGRGRYPVERVDQILDSGDRRMAGPTAPAHGLCLESVRYPRE